MMIILSAKVLNLNIADCVFIANYPVKSSSQYGEIEGESLISLNIMLQLCSSSRHKEEALLKLCCRFFIHSVNFAVEKLHNFKEEL